MLRLLARHGDVLLAVGVVAAVGILVVPLPTGLVDVLLACSLSGAVVLLLAATWVRHPTRFSSLPAILLLATLFRLALNVSTTRLILSRADAGAVIDSFGSFVVAGNYVVGGVIFVILTVIQYVVIAKGAERIAEVSARFTLDALPGRQMAIDADLRSGALTLAEAQRLRAELQRESRLYGALDGAMKFVKGDAIAGIVITLVNIVAGLSIGVLQQGMPLQEAARRYTLLTVGDGLVAQIPAILTATAAGVVVTQVADASDRGNLARDIGRQLAAYPRALAVTAGLLLVFALLPGLPFLPFALLGVFLGVVAWGVRREGAGEATEQRGEPAAEAVPAEVVVRAGAGLAAALERERRALEAGLRELRAELAERAGVALPELALAGTNGRVARAGAAVPADDEVWLELDGVPSHRAAISAGPDAERVARTLAALRSGLLEALPELVTVQAVAERLEVIAVESPALVEAVVPQRLEIPGLAALVRRLLAEGVALGRLSRLLEVVAAAEPGRLALDALVEHARRGLSRRIAHQLADADGTIRALALDGPVEEMVRSAARQTSGGPRLALEREISDAIGQAVAAEAEAHAMAGRPVVVTQSDVRPHVWRLLAPRFPSVAVVSWDELAAAPRVQAVGRVKVGSE